MRWIARVAAAVATVVVFALSLAAGVLLHLDHPTTRRIVAAVVTRESGRALQGSIELGVPTGLSVRSIECARVVVRDDAGEPLVIADCLSAAVDLRALVESFLASEGPVRLVIPRVSILNADVTLDPARLERAFSPRDEPGPAPPPAESRPLTIALERVSIRHAWVHGHPEGAPPMDADAEDVEASLRVGPPGIEVDLERARISARRVIDRAGVTADASGWLDVPTEGDLRLFVDANANVGGRLPALVTVSLEGDHLDTSVVVPPVSGETLGARAPRGSLSGRARARGDLPELEWNADLQLDGATAAVSGTASLEDEPIVRAHARIDDADVRAFVPGAPSSDLTISIDLDLTIAERGPRGRASVRASGHVAGRPAPLLLAAAVFDPREVSVAGMLERGGNAARLDGTLDLEAAPPTGRARLVLDVPHLETIAPLPALKAGRVHGTANARFVLGEKPRAAASASVSIRELRVASARVGTATVRASVLIGRAPSGRVEVDGSGIWFGGSGPARTHLDATLRGRRITLNANAAHPGIGHVFVNSSTLELGGPAEKVDSWRNAVGAVQLDTEIDLARVASSMQETSFPLSEAKGKILVLAEVARASAGQDPSLEIFAQTQGLVIAPPVATRPPIGKTKVIVPPPWRLAGVDAKLDALVEPDGAAMMRGELSDRRGALAAFAAEGTVPVRELVRARARALQRWMDAPMAFHVRVPTRPISSLPSWRYAQLIGGDVEATLSVEGTPRRPVVHADARVLCLQVAPQLPRSDATLTATYDAGIVDARALFENHRGGSLTATARVDAGARTVPELLVRRGRRWTADASAELDAFRLESLLSLVREDVRGTVTGSVKASIPDGAPSASADLSLSKMSIFGAPYGEGRVRARLDAREIDLSAELRQDEGFVEASATAPIRWRGRTSLELDPARDVDAKLKADDFRIAALTPLLEDVVSRLDGYVDADMRFVAGPKRREMSGKATLERGIFHLPSLGQELEAVHAEMTLTPDGVLKIDRVTAKSLGGNVLAAATGRLDGPDLVALRAVLRIPKQTPMPLTIQGQGYGDVWGDARIDIAPEREALRVEAWLDRIRVELLPSSPHDLQQLEPADHIRVGMYQAPRRFVLLPLAPPKEPRSGDARKVEIALHLRDVEVRRGDGVRVELGGDPKFTLNDELRGSGQIALEGGRLYVQGKRFEIERGTVSFDGRDLGNPDVMVTAAWTAPDGTRVYADFVGPLKTGKVTLRSAPALSRDQILALILFGTPSGPDMAPEAGSGGAEQALGLGGGVATQGLNRAIDDVTGLDVTTRIDTSEASSPRPEVEVRIAKDLSLQIAHVLGTPPPWGNPDRNFVTLTWRLGGAWSLETTVGDEGSSILDLVWQRAY